MGLFFIPFALFVIIGSSNAVNLTDGLDGLATVPVMLVALSFMLISYVVGNTIFSEYLQLQYIPDVGEISIFCGSIVFFFDLDMDSDGPTVIFFLGLSFK